MATEQQIIEKLKQIMDPEIPISIYDLGLVYDIQLEESGNVKIDMTLTAPGCPLYNILVGKIKEAIAGLEGVNDVEVNLVWEPRWTPERITEEGKEGLRKRGFNI